MKEESTKVADIFKKDINKLCDDINLVIQAHNKLVDENENLKMKIDKAIEYMNSLEFFELMNSTNQEDYFKAKNKLLEILGGKE